ncbi:MAG: methylmalonyl Co-A mutase-associated GTPase MeaB [Pseudomonadota bacterium]|nr:methylmalonyl Co-A mutase-associated GTPase MeaB [Pseudomonadota bacterium]
MSLASDILSGDRAALARAITLIESTREDHQREARDLLSQLWPKAGNSLRIGITGAPGVGKSTFIEALGLHIAAQGHRLAVLAVDPSSSVTGGSILGDKTRMGKLSQQENVFIRPTAAGGTLGGVARRTREAMLLCEASGYDVILIETVGVGQSETEVADMTDMLALLLSPGGGDELQGIKRGIVELADLLIVNKADGELAAQAKRTQADYAAALKLLHPAGRQPKVLTCSALHGEGLGDIWKTMEEFLQRMRDSGERAHYRALQAKSWMWKEIRETLLERFLQHPRMAAEIEQAEQMVMSGSIAPSDAAAQLIRESGILPR